MKHATRPHPERSYVETWMPSAPVALLVAPLVTLLVVLPPLAAATLAVTCPASGSKVDVCVANLTNGVTPTIELEGRQITSEMTCSGLSQSYSHTFSLLPGETRCFEGPNALPQTGSGLNSGMWIHEIWVAATGQHQYQQGPVLFSTTGDWADVNWSYYPFVSNVNRFGASSDSACGNGACPDASGNCTLRQAIEKANAAAGPTLVRFAGSGTINVTQSCPLALTAGYTMIDGTDSNGNPWIVGDRNAAKPINGNQDPIPVVIDLHGLSYFRIVSPENTIKGVHIKNTLPANTVQDKNLIYVLDGGASSQNRVTVRSVKIDGGNTLDCMNPPPGVDCEALSRDLVNVEEDGAPSWVINVEGHSARDKGVKALGNVDVVDGWFHHNYRGGLQATSTPSLGGGFLAVHRTHVELNGRRLGDDAIMHDGANGLSANGFGSTGGSQNVVWLNRNNGIVSRGAFPFYTSFDDYSCGNRFSGLVADGFPEPGSSEAAACVVAVGSAVAYNGGPGVSLAGMLDPTLFTLQPDNAFAQNDDATGCDVRNDGDIQVSAANNQWTNGVPQTCGTTPVTTNPVQDHVTEPIDLSETLPVFPSNVILDGQTIRIGGKGFNAIDGNPPVDGTCVRGDSPADSCCLEKPQAANKCAQGTHNPILGSGNCVEVLIPSTGGYNDLLVTSVTPTTIVAELIHEVLSCTGDDSRIWVSKRVTQTLKFEDSFVYCTNDRQLDDPPGLSN